MYKLKFKLKQHTPIIHFQSDDYGATLRASEVKPKLDKFIIKKLRGAVQARKDHPSWFHNKDKPALDYKMHFKTINGRKIEIEARHKNSPMYFGNMGDGKNKHMVVSDGIDGVVKTIHKGLKELVESHLSEFFFLHNFGTRQSKGYGSYTLENASCQENLYKYSFNVRETEYKAILDNIGWFYQSLRSGFNLNIGGNTIYMKPAIFHYLHSQGKIWDKKTIKEAYVNNDTPTGRNNYKDLMGLSSSEQWKDQKFTITKEDVSEEVSRYKSPILFKPVQNGGSTTVYFDYFEPEYLSDFIGTTFLVKSNDRGSLRMIVPNDFDFNKFLIYVKEMNINNKIEQSGGGFPGLLKNKLTAIYNQL